MAEFVDENTSMEQAFGGTVGGTIDELSGELQLTERQNLIRDEIKQSPSHTAKSLARRIGLSSRTVEREISFLRNNGFIDKKDKSTHSEWIILK